MRAYQVTFFKDLVSSNGHRFACPQLTIQILRARSCERAITAAQRRFERLRDHAPENSTPTGAKYN